MALRNYLFLFGIGLIWGSQFIFQQIAVADLSPVWVGAGRSLTGFLTLLLTCKLLGITGHGGQWLKYSLIGLLEATIPFVMVAWGQQYLDTAIAAILMGTVPFFTVIMAPLIIKGARITTVGLSSVILGLCGLLVLFYPDLKSGGMQASLMGAAAIIFAAICFALALLLLKNVTKEHPLIVARNVLGVATVQILVVAMIISPITQLQPTTSSISAVIYLGVMCAGFVYFLYMTLIKNAGPVFASFSNYLVPMVGVLLGATFNNEALTIYTWVALVIILLAVAFNQTFEARKNKIDPKQLKAIMS
ncbi:DMT family transporter [Candidatus Sororendozoicomonas aggregata]|uniref:DMT family transporter n=1 Tax=Candidatus Sororendozoicomonas aggregata TaxID=3073239 RepID=UPI002ED69298